MNTVYVSALALCAVAAMTTANAAPPTEFPASIGSAELAAAAKACPTAAFGEFLAGKPVHLTAASEAWNRTLRLNIQTKTIGDFRDFAGARGPYPMALGTACSFWLDMHAKVVYGYTFTAGRVKLEVFHNGSAYHGDDLVFEIK